MTASLPETAHAAQFEPYTRRQISGQLTAGFVLTGFYEDFQSGTRWPNSRPR